MKKNEIMLSRNELILDSTYRKPMSKKRWKQPNYFLWECVFMIAMYILRADSFAISLLALAVMAVSCFKLKDMDLSEECNTGLHFNSH